GLTRSSALEHYKARSAVEGVEQAVNGHQASLFTRGFEGEARLVRLAQAALTDLLRQSRAINWPERQHAFYLALPDGDRIHTGAELIADDDVRRAWVEAEAAREDPAPQS